MLCTLAALALVAAAEPVQVIELGQPQAYEAVFTAEIQATKLTASEWVFFAARPLELPGQPSAKAVFEPNGKNAEELSRKRPIVSARIPARTKELQKAVRIEIKYEVMLQSRRLVPAAQPAKIADLTKAERDSALAAGGQYDFNAPAFKSWLAASKLERAKTEAELDFARRAFLDIKKRFTYEYRSDLDRHAVQICKAGKSDCGGLALLYASVLRANGIPARLRVGRWALSSTKETDALQAHVKCEFFINGIGWVPADPAVAIVHDKTPAGLECFGNDRGDFITLHIDPDLEVDTFHFGKKKVEWLQGISFWVAGKGTFDGKLREDWQVRKLP